MLALFKRTLLAVAVIAAYLAAAASYAATPHSATYLVSTMLTIGIGFFVLSKNRLSSANRAFFYFSLCFSGFLMSIYASHMAAAVWGIDRGEIAIRLFRFGTHLLPVALMHFGHQFIDRRSRLLRVLVWLSFLSMLPFIVLNLAGRFVTEFRVAGSTYVPAGRLWPYQASVAIEGLWFLIWSLVVTARCFRSSERHRRPQYLFLLLGTVPGLTAGLLSAAPAFGTSWYPSVIGGLYALFPLCMGIAVFWANMFDIRIVVRRTLPYAVVTGVIGALYALGLMGLAVFGEHVGSPPSGAGAVILLVLVGFGFQPALEALQKGLDRLFFRAEAEVDGFLAEAGRRYSATHSDVQLSRMIATDAKTTLYLEDCAVLLGKEEVRTPAGGLAGLDLDEVVGLPMPRATAEGVLVEAEANGALDIPGGAGPLSKTLENAGVMTVVPFASGDTRGLIACTRKLSDLPLSGRDRMFLRALAAQAGTALARIRADSAASELRIQTAAIFDAITNAVALVDSQGRVVDSNPAFVRAFGEPGGRPINELGLSAAVGAVSGARELETGKGLFLANAKVLDAGEKGQITVLVLTDITELRRLEEASRRQEILAELGGAISAINHEIMNILSPVGFHLNRARRAETLEGVREEVEHVNQSMDALNRLTRELRDYYRAPALSPRSVSFKDVVDSCLADIADEVGESWVSPEVSGLDVTLRADPQKLKQAVLNILKNAWDAMQHRARKEWSVHAAKEGQVARIDVRDSGTGISPESLERVFEPFYSTKRERGTGLGLSIVQRIADAHGAEVNVEGEPGHGTVVSLLWPVAD